MCKSKIKYFVLVLVIVLGLGIFMFSYVFFDREDVNHSQQCTGTIAYIAKDFYSDDYIIYVDVDSAYSAKEKLRQFVLSSETIMLSDAVDIECDKILESRIAGFPVEITYKGTQIEIEDKLWVYPVEMIVFHQPEQSK